MENARKEEIDYWLFSNAERARFCRCRNEVPLELVSGVTDEEAQRICSKIRERLDNGEFHEIYVKILVFFNDQSAPDILRKLKQQFKERQRLGIPPGCTWSAEIRLLKDAIKHLKRVR